jgi:uncharacterized protein
MTSPAKAAAARPLLDMPRAPPKRSLLGLGQDEAAHLVANTRPPPWLDGLITAMVVAPEYPEDWLDHIWADGALEGLTPAQAKDIESMVEDHFCHVLDVLFESPHIYCLHLDGESDHLEAAAQWAAGFRFGIRLHPEPWRPLFDDDTSRILVAAIFSLERDESLTEEDRANALFRDISPERLEEMRRTVVPMLPDIVRGLHGFSLALDNDLDDGDFGEQHHLDPTIRNAPKIGRNDPCPCGSGKKYKKCCLDGDEGQFS